MLHHLCGRPLEVLHMLSIDIGFFSLIFLVHSWLNLQMQNRAPEHRRPTLCRYVFPIL